MDKNAIKKFAVWARKKLLEDIKYQASLLGITEKGIAKALPQSTAQEEYYDIGTKNPYVIKAKQIAQRQSLVDAINGKAQDADYQTAYNNIIEEVAYTWFNRLIAVRFMEVNDYLPCKIRVLSAADGRQEPDIVQNPFDARLDFTEQETAAIVQLQNDHEYNKLFQYLFIKVCNDLSNPLPQLFEHEDDYTELLLNISYIDEDGLVYKLVHDIAEDDFNVSSDDGQVEIIGWLYQYYISEKHDEIINIYKGTVKADDIPAATQLFTTDWVVKYMVDNSLGRYYLERKDDIDLEKQLTFLVKPKSGILPRVQESIALDDLKFFDPCMGSGHILIYAFDILMQMYLNQGYTEKDAVISILQHNLYGLDIDKRAYQLAYFSIMMKARQYYKLILRKNVQCNLYAVPESNKLLAKQEQLKYFGAGMDDFSKNIALTEIRGLLDDFKDAKEYGSLINVQNYNWELLQQLAADFDISTEPNMFATYNIEITQKQLQEIVTVGQILANKYTVVCTNPPYLNKYNPVLKKFVNDNYKDYSGDLFSVFIYKNFSFCQNNGYLGFMTPFVWMFIKTYEKLRQLIIASKAITTLVQMEYSAFEEATVPICSFVLQNGKSSNKALCFRLSDFKGGMQIQKEKVLEAIQNPECGYFYEADQNNFSKIPGSPVAYWVSYALLNDFSVGEVLKNTGDTRQGMATSDNNRFLRLWMEVAFDKLGIGCASAEDALVAHKKWYPYNKGGEFRKWYGNIDYVVNYENDGFEVKQYAASLYKSVTRTIKSISEYFKPCLSWSKVSSGSIAFRFYPQGFIFDVAGCCIFYTDKSIMLYHFAFINSKVVKTILSAISPTLNYEAGHIASLPVIESRNDFIIIEKMVQDNILIGKADWDSFETSWDFSKHPLVQTNSTVAEAYSAWKQECEERFTQLKANEEELNRIFIDIYNLQKELTPDVADKDVTVYRIFDNKEAVPASMQGSKYVLTKSDVIKSLLSYAVGCMFGRYSLDVEGLAYAGGEWDDSKYQTFIPDADNVIPITDEDYFEDDLVGRFISWLKVVYGEENLEENLRFIAEALNTKGDTPRQKIRNYFIKDFFKYHCKIYQKRPIYWLYDSGKQDGFKALIYMHRYTKDTTGTVRAEYLEKMIRIYDSEIARMQNIMETASGRETAKAEKNAEKLRKQLKECRDYDEKVGHLALSDISIDLDDGVKVNYEKVQKDNNGEFLQILAKI